MQKIILLCIVSSYMHACEKIDLKNFPLIQSIISNSQPTKQIDYIKQYVKDTINSTLPDSIVNQKRQNYVILSIYTFIHAHKNKSLAIVKKEKLLSESAQALTQAFSWLRKPALCQQDCFTQSFFHTIENALWWQTYVEKIPFARTIKDRVMERIKQVMWLYHYFFAR